MKTHRWDYALTHQRIRVGISPQKGTRPSRGAEEGAADAGASGWARVYGAGGCARRRVSGDRDKVILKIPGRWQGSTWRQLPLCSVRQGLPQRWSSSSIHHKDSLQHGFCISQNHPRSSFPGVCYPLDSPAIVPLNPLGKNRCVTSKFSARGGGGFLSTGARCEETQNSCGGSP